MTYEYDVYDKTIVMYESDERYVEDDDHEDNYSCDTIEEARETIKSLLEGMDEPYVIHHTKRWLDSIEYHVLGIERYVWDDDIDDWEFDESYEDMDAVSTLPEDVERKARESQRSYHAYLDWETDEYHGIE